MTSDWFGGGAQEVGLGTLGDGVLWVDWTAQWEKPVQNNRRPVRTHQSVTRESDCPTVPANVLPRRSSSLVVFLKRWTGRPEPRGS